LPIVVSQFGVHLIEIMEKGTPTRQVQVATLERKLEPSQKTYDFYYNKANEFASQNTSGEQFDSSIIQKGFNKRIADNLRENDKNVPGLEQPRELVRWAYQAEKGDVSKVFTFGDKYVIAHLVDIKEKGILPLDEVRDQVTAEVRKQKKAEMLIEKFKAASGTNIDDIARKLNTTAVDAENVSFQNAYVPGLGNEPQIAGTLYTMKQGEISRPIKGENAVAVVAVTRITEPEPVTDYTQTINQLAEQLRSRSDYELFNAMKEKANIVDNRGRFY
jgi:peptidyl-prolyl cis-trans isomerase D